MMQARVAAIRAGTAGELVWLVEHPPLYTAGTSAKPEELTDPTRFPTFNAGRGGQWTYHGPGQRTAYVMLDLTRPHGRVPPQDIRCYVNGLEEWLIRTLDRFNVKGERREGRVGIWVADPATGGEGQDRRHRRARHPLGHLARRRAQRRSEPQRISAASSPAACRNTASPASPRSAFPPRCTTPTSRFARVGGGFRG